MVPHPLRDEMVLTIGVGDGQEVTARRILKEAARACNVMFKEWSEQWSSNNTKTATAAPVTAEQLALFL
jgi:DNA-directed RNA polymerase subunit L